MDDSKPYPPRVRADPGQSGPSDDPLRRLLTPNERTNGTPTTISPTNGKDPARDAAMNYVRRMRIYAR